MPKLTDRESKLYLRVQQLRPDMGENLFRIEIGYKDENPTVLYLKWADLETMRQTFADVLFVAALNGGNRADA